MRIDGLGISILFKCMGYSGLFSTCTCSVRCRLLLKLFKIEKERPCLMA